MKKLLTLMLAGAIAVSFAGCGASGDSAKTETNSSSSQKKDDISDPLSLLEKVWGSYSEEEKFPAGGGDFSEENMRMDNPGKYSIADAEALDNALGFPAGSAGRISDAASLVHMMNSNTFTAAAFEAKDEKEAETLTGEIKSNILGRQWMCGMPDKVIIASSGRFVVVCFGENQLVDTFKTKLTAAYPSAGIVSEDAITA